MIAEILATGDEIRSGALVDSNSAYIADRLECLGVDVTRHHCVGDALEPLIEVILEIGGRADIALVTGGLGPTVDDRSAEAAAAAAGVGMELDRSVLEEIEAFFRTRGRPCSPTNRKQAMIPSGADCLHNPVGTAPGFALDVSGCRFFFMPGVPYEMKRMLEHHVLPRIREMQGGRRQHSLVRTLATFGLPESTAGERVAEVSERFPGIVLGLRAKFPEIQVKFYLRTEDEKAGQTLLDEAVRWAAGQLGANLFSLEGESMAETVGRLLLDRRETLAVAESCTGGLVGNWITNTAGSSDYFLFSAVTYHNRTKTVVLGVEERALIDHGAVHPVIAGQMAEGAKRVAGSTYGLAITGIAGPGGGTDDKPVGTVCLGLTGPGGTATRRLHFAFGRRLMNKRLFATAALDMLRRELGQETAL
jgi:nicotinamide-nucleotide amidase